MSRLSPNSNYSAFNLPDIDGTRVVDENPRVKDILLEFSQLGSRGDDRHGHGDILAVSDNGIFQAPREFRYTKVNQEGVNAAFNHFQGIQRLRAGRYAVISGADFTEPSSHLFVIRCGSRDARFPWSSNLTFTGEPPEDDAVVRVIALDRGLWHPGGISALGDVLAVGLDGNGPSRVMFFHMADPENPTRFPARADIQRPSRAKSSAVALAKIPDRGYLCAVWWEDGDADPEGRIDFHVSRGTDLRDGFLDEWVRWEFDQALGDDRPEPRYQSVNFVTADDMDAGDGRIRLYLIGTENDAAGAPVQNGRNWADLFEVLVDPAIFGDPAGHEPRLTLRKSKEFHAPREYCNFDAAAGVYVSRRGELLLYGGYHWQVHNSLRFAEFRANPDPHVELTDPRLGWIELYEHDSYRGKRLTILGDRDASIGDYDGIFVEGGDFNDKVSSVRFHLPKNVTYRLYKDREFRGTKKGTDFIDLRGTGRVREIKDLKKAPQKFGDKVSSSRYV
jgi:hypothetical protein